MTHTAPDRHEALVRFLRDAPIGLVQCQPDGQITSMNPLAARLLLPLQAAGGSAGLFELLAPVAPHLAALATRPATAGEPLCQDLPLSLPTLPPAASVAAAAAPTCSVLFSLAWLDSHTLAARLSPVAAARPTALAQQPGDSPHEASRSDSLTRMPNRRVVLERIERALQRAAADSGYRFAVLFINGDRFNRINITLGPAAGDGLLRQMAARLNGTVRLNDAVARSAEPEQTTARLGGDEFVVLLEGLRHADDLPHIAQRLIDTLAKPYRIGEQVVHTTASIGVVLHSQAVGSAESVLQDASLAMRDAKRAGGARFCLFEPEMKARAWRRSSLEGELRQGLAEGQLYVVYQPIIDLASGRPSGVEALVRWQHPSRGNIPPVEFIGIAEETGLICPLGEFVLKQACAQFATWQRTLGAQAPGTLSVNLSRAQLAEPGLLALVGQALGSNGLSADQLQLEVTESLAAQDLGIQNRLHELKALGVSLALDDFGTGYSSLASLHLLPVDVVKIDRAFVSQAETSTHHRVLIEATVRVARSLGMRTVAEGIETEGQAAVLVALQCDKGQGYLYARPLPAGDATRWLTGLDAGSGGAGTGTSTVCTPADPAAAQPSPAPPLHTGAHSAVLKPPAALVEQLLAALDTSQVAVALFDPQERLAYANRSYRQLHWDGLDGMPTWETVMRQAHRRRQGVLIETADIDGWLARVRQRYRRQPLRIFESDITDGRWMRVNEETRADGWQLCVSTDVTSLKANETTLRRARDSAVRASVTDPLTELPNRRFVFDRLAVLMAEAGATGQPLSVALIDLDHFKAINDQHGHAMGDQVLLWFAQCLGAQLRPQDAAGRIGGDEFLLVLGQTDHAGTQVLLAELRHGLQQLAQRLCEAGVPVDFSAGIAEMRPEDTPDLLIRRADQQLYQAKAAGRGRSA